MNAITPSLALDQVEIDSERLCLRPISERFAEDIYRNFTPAITRYMFPAPAESIADTQAFIAESMQKRIRGHDLTLVILDGATGEFVGVCGLHRIGKATDPELGIWIRQSAHGNGYGKESIRALIGWAKNTLSCAALVYPVDRRNMPSRRIPEGLGAQIVQECAKTSMSGHALDILVYRIEAAMVDGTES